MISVRFGSVLRRRKRIRSPAEEMYSRCSASITVAASAASARTAMTSCSISAALDASIRPLRQTVSTSPFLWDAT